MTTIRAALVAACMLTACEEGGEHDTSCEGVAAHIEDVCHEGIGSIEAEMFRYNCDTGETYFEPELTCLASTTECDDQSFGRCDYHAISHSCSMDDQECLPGLRCDVEREECVACFSESDCEDGRLCLEGWCVRDTPTNRMFATLFTPPDAGASSP